MIAARLRGISRTRRDTRHERMADELGRLMTKLADIAVVGVVATLPAELERGERFEWSIVEASHAARRTVRVPSQPHRHGFSARLAATEPVQPGERWAFAGCDLKRPHG